MKSLAILQATAMLAVVREQVPLHRDLIFLGTADEEVDDRGSQLMIRYHAELVRDASFADGGRIGRCHCGGAQPGRNRICGEGAAVDKADSHGRGARICRK